MTCKCTEPGINGSVEHSGELHILQWIHNPMEAYDWIGKQIVACDNHLRNYRNTGFFEEVV